MSLLNLIKLQKINVDNGLKKKKTRAKSLKNFEKLDI